MKRLILIFCAMIIFTLLIADGTPAEGSGTENEPYQIETLDNLLWLSTTEAVWDSCYFQQTADIDASDTQIWNDGAGFSPIGLNFDNPFLGNYNGGTHEIDSLHVNRPDENIGLFGYTFGADIEALGVTNANITGWYSVGGLMGLSFGSTLIACYASGNVNGYSDIGGLVGCMQNNSTMSDCYATGSMSGEQNVGGLVGSNKYSSFINESYAICSVNGPGVAGGLVGHMTNNSSITDSYATGSVSGQSTVGGLTG